MSDITQEVIHHHAQRAELENTIHAIWVETLELNDIAMDDNFFELGGHSLMAIEITGRIRALLGANQFPVDLLDTPTIAKLTDAILKRLHAGVVS